MDGFTLKEGEANNVLPPRAIGEPPLKSIMLMEPQEPARPQQNQAARKTHDPPAEHQTKNHHRKHAYKKEQQPYRTIS